VERTALRVTEVSPGVCRLATRNENWYVLDTGGRVTVLRVISVNGTIGPSV
jgi:hypothetical protein